MKSSVLFFAAVLPMASVAAAESDGFEMPVSDTEDASLGFETVGKGRLHPMVTFDVRNGDFVRGSYDDDGANLDRLPVHAQLGLVIEAAHDAQGATSWVELRSSNGFHAPGPRDRSSPRAWYETNNLVGLISRLGPNVTGAVTYTIKTSPNDVSGTTHELSAAFALDGKGALGRLSPGFVATWRPKGGSGFYTQATIEPSFDLALLGPRDQVSFPAAVGIGWSGFYADRSGTRVFGSVGMAYKHPFRLGGAHLALRAQMIAWIRDDRLRRLDGPAANTRVMEPQATIAISYAY